MFILYSRNPYLSVSIGRLKIILLFFEYNITKRFDFKLKKVLFLNNIQDTLNLTTVSICLKLTIHTYYDIVRVTTRITIRQHKTHPVLN